MSPRFHHMHLIGADPKAAAKWYEDIHGGEILADHTLRDTPQISIRVDGIDVIIRDAG